MSEDKPLIGYADTKTDAQRAGESLDLAMTRRLAKTLGWAFLSLGLLLSGCVCAGMAAASAPMSNMVVLVVAWPLAFLVIPAILLLSLRDYLTPKKKGPLVAMVVISVWILAGMGAILFGQAWLMLNTGDFANPIALGIILLTIAAGVVKLLFHAVRLLVTGGRSGGSNDLVVDVFKSIGNAETPTEAAQRAHGIGGAAMATGVVVVLLAAPLTIFSTIGPKPPPPPVPPPALPGTANPWNSDTIGNYGLPATDRKRVVELLTNDSPLMPSMAPMLDDALRENGLPMADVKTISEGTSLRSESEALFSARRSTGNDRQYFYGSIQARGLRMHFSQQQGNNSLELREMNRTQIYLSSDQRMGVSVNGHGGSTVRYSAANQAVIDALGGRGPETISQRQGDQIVRALRDRANAIYQQSPGRRIEVPRLIIGQQAPDGTIEVSIDDNKMLVHRDGLTSNLTMPAYLNPPKPPAPPPHLDLSNTAAGALTLAGLALAVVGGLVWRTSEFNRAALAIELYILAAVAAVSIAVTIWLTLSWIGLRPKALLSAPAVTLVMLIPVAAFIGILMPLKVALALQRQLPPPLPPAY